MPRHGAQVGVHAILLKGDDELRRLAGPDQRCALPVDLEVVLHMADVLEDERDLAGFLIDLVESLKKYSPPLTWIVVAVGVACRSVRAEPSGASASAAIATAANVNIERIVSCLIAGTSLG